MPLNFLSLGPDFYQVRSSFTPDFLSHDCIAGDYGTEPYLVSHHQLLTRAAAVKVYRDKHQVSICSLNKNIKSIQLGNGKWGVGEKIYFLLRCCNNWNY